MEKITIITRRSKNENKNSNGGDYTEGINFFPCSDGEYEVHYWTSSSMEFCSRCGCYNDHDQWNSMGFYKSKYCNPEMGYEKVNKKKLDSYLKKYKNLNE